MYAKNDELYRLKSTAIWSFITLAGSVSKIFYVPYFNIEFTVIVLTITGTFLNIVGYILFLPHLIEIFLPCF